MNKRTVNAKSRIKSFTYEEWLKMSNMKQLTIEDLIKLKQDKIRLQHNQDKSNSGEKL